MKEGMGPWGRKFGREKGGVCSLRHPEKVWSSVSGLEIKEENGLGRALWREFSPPSNYTKRFALKRNSQKLSGFHYTT